MPIINNQPHTYANFEFLKIRTFNRLKTRHECDLMCTAAI